MSRYSVPLAMPSELEGFKGAASLTREQVEAAGDAVRTYCRWHIAPLLEEELLLDSEGGPLLRLPSLRVAEVLSVHLEAPGEEPVVVAPSEYEWSRDGLLLRRGGARWPRGYRRVRVRMRHGYESIPPELKPTLLRRAQRRAIQESLGARSATYESDERYAEADLEAYRLGPHV